MSKKLVAMSLLIFSAAVLAGCNDNKKPSAEKDMMTENEKGVEQQSKADTMTKDSMTTKDEMETQEESASEYTDIPVEHLKMMIDEGQDFVILDVSPKYAEGHIPGAINYYVGDGSLDKAIPSLDKNATYVVYCHNDSASILGAQKLIDAGFKDVLRLMGNYSAWVDAGYPVEK